MGCLTDTNTTAVQHCRSALLPKQAICNGPDCIAGQADESVRVTEAFRILARWTEVRAVAQLEVARNVLPIKS